MRRYNRLFAVLVVLMSCLIISVTAMASDKNLLLNPSVEKAKPTSAFEPSDWRTWKSVGDQYTVDFEWSDKVARSGKCSLKIGAVSEGGKATWQSTSVDVALGMTYRASVYVKVQGAKVGEVITLTINWRDSNSTRLGTISETFIITKSDIDWTLVTVEGVAPKDCTQAGIQVGRIENNQGSVWFDDFELVLVK